MAFTALQGRAGEQLSTRVTALVHPASNDAALDAARLHALGVGAPSPLTQLMHTTVRSPSFALHLSTHGSSGAQACWKEALQLPAPWTANTALEDIIIYLSNSITEDSILGVREYQAACQLLCEVRPALADS